MIRSVNSAPHPVRGFALVVCMIMVALLTIMAVAYLFSSGTDRVTGKAAANKAKADLAAQAAVNAAISRLTETLATYPDSATTWEAVNQAGGSVQYQGSVIYYRDQTPERVPGTFSPLHALPLISGAQPVQIGNPPQTLAGREATLRGALPVLEATNSFDLNHARFSGDNQGLIGAPPGATSRPEFRGQWIDLKDTDGKVTSRYAYWMEDESFKVNANFMGNTLRGPNTLGDAPSQIPLQGLLKTLDISGNPDAIANQAVTFRASFPGSVFFESRALNQIDGQPTLADNLKFEATIHSGASNLSRSGSKRINLNKVVSASTDPVEIRKQLDQITKTITHHLPNFAQRFYRTGTNKNSLDVPSSGSPSHQTIYLNKIAANIRDYIDSDSQPTIVNNDAALTIRIGSAPTSAISISGTTGPNEVAAIGKERVPFVQEYALRVRQIAFSPRTGAFANYTISIDHYVELWNMANRDILLSDLGPNPFLLVAAQPGWDAAALDDIPESPTRDLKLFLRNARRADNNSPLVSFPAGSVTVLTTDPQPLSTNGSSTPVQTGPLTPDLTRVYNIPVTPASLRTYSGRTQKKTSVASGSELRLNLITRTTSSSDYETEIALGNDLGLLESAWGAAPISSAISVNIDNASPPENRLDNTKYHFRGGHLRGMTTAAALATTGDARTNAEQITLTLNGGPTGNTDKTRYVDSGVDSNNIPGNSTLGAPNSNYSIPSLWPDYSSNNPSANDAPMVIADASLTSIGQLGDIFDPARVKGDSGDITLSRSGGRTLKIGQPERYDGTVNSGGLWDGNSNSASREWTAWRLTDLFSAADAVQLDGRININGVDRDGGAALKTALYGYVFQPSPNSDPRLAGKTFDADPSDPDDKVNELIKQMQARLKNDPTPGVYEGQFGTTIGPFAERGELSEMPLFNTGNNLDPSVTTANTYDRGREELFRRLLELTTTRGNIFTVYAVGQALIPQRGTAPPVTVSTSQQKITFRVDPIWNAGPPADPFDPNTVSRFAKPDHYAIKILYAGE